MIFEGSKLDVNSLRITIYSGTNPVTASSVKYNINQNSVSYLTGDGTYDVGTGAYYPDVTLPLGLVNSTNIDWTIIASGVGTFTTRQTFTIYSNNLVTANTDIFSGKTKEYITLLRYALRDFNPDLYYRFNPAIDPERNYTDNYKQSVIWQDQELYYYLYLALSDVNSKPPLTKYTFDTLPAQYMQSFMASAKYQAVASKALNWAAEDYVFNVGQSTVSIERQDKYMRMYEVYFAQYQTLIEQTKKATEKFVTLRGKYV